MEKFSLQNIRQSEGLIDKLMPLKNRLEQKLNLGEYRYETKPLNISNNTLQRFALAAGLTLTEERQIEEIEEVSISKTGLRIHETTFSKFHLQNTWVSLLKLRYHQFEGLDWESQAFKSRVVNYEMLKGLEYLLKDNNLEEWLNVSANESKASFGEIPELKLNIGTYADDITATLDLNSRNIPNTQILIAGTTGSGKSNLLAVLMREMRNLTIDTSYPVNFLFFDYKGEFSDPANRGWFSHFEIDDSAILDPIREPLPFSPFKDFSGKTQNEINLYATQLANALCAIDNARISANMSNRLSEAVIEAYKTTNNRPITFEIILESYKDLQTEKDQEKDDSIKSVLKQLIRNNLFSEVDSIDLVKDSYIVNMSNFPKDGPLAKAIVYFIISKLNTIYETLPKQAVSDECVEIRHFTIIDEAHYMLDFDNKPLRDLIAVGRNKGLSIILATQNMDAYKSRYFDFYANAQYPLIMKQQSITDSVIKDLFGVSGNEFQEIKEAISNLALGELIIKNPTAVALGMGKKYKKIKTNHLI
jgi:energy-coupling factor transporter ATP-binding protein EcfA2